MKLVLTLARAAAAAALAVAFLPSPAAAQAVIKVNDNVNFKLGFQFQGWADWTQSAATGGYAQNLFARRARLLVGGQVAAAGPREQFPLLLGGHVGVSSFRIFSPTHAASADAASARRVMSF